MKFAQLFYDYFTYQKLPFLYEQETVYEICYNSKEGKTMYTRHSLTSTDILFDKRLENEKYRKLTMMTNTDGNFGDNEFSRLEIFYDLVSIIFSPNRYLFVQSCTCQKNVLHFVNCEGFAIKME